MNSSLGKFLATTFLFLAPLVLWVEEGEGQRCTRDGGCGIQLQPAQLKTPEQMAKEKADKAEAEKQHEERRDTLEEALNAANDTLAQRELALDEAFGSIDELDETFGLDKGFIQELLDVETATAQVEAAQSALDSFNAANPISNISNTVLPNTGGNFGGGGGGFGGGGGGGGGFGQQILGSLTQSLGQLPALLLANAIGGGKGAGFNPLAALGGFGQNQNPLAALLGQNQNPFNQFGQNPFNQFGQNPFNQFGGGPFGGGQFGGQGPFNSAGSGAAFGGLSALTNLLPALLSGNLDPAQLTQILTQAGTQAAQGAILGGLNQAGGAGGFGGGGFGNQFNQFGNNGFPIPGINNFNGQAVNTAFIGNQNNLSNPNYFNAYTAISTDPFLQTASSNQLYERGRDLERRGDIGSALPFYEQALAREQSGNVQNQLFLRDELAGAYFANNDKNQAIALYQSNASVDPSYKDTLLNLGLLYQDQKQTAQAEAALASARTIYPNDARTHSALGNLYLEQKSFDKALAPLQRAADIRKGADDHVSLGIAQERLGQNEAALASFREAKTKNANYPEIDQIISGLQGKICAADSSNPSCATFLLP